MSDTVSVNWNGISGGFDGDFNLLVIFSLLVVAAGVILNDWRFAVVGLVGVVLTR